MYLKWILALAAMAAATGYTMGRAKKMENKQETVNKWFTSHCYLNGLTAYPHDSVNREAFYQHYQKHPERWDATFKFLRETNLDSLPVGKYKLLEDDVVVSVTEGTTRPMGNTRWEFHKRFIDLQYIYKGREMMGAAPIGSLTPTTPYDDTKDVGFGDVNGGSYYEMDSQSFQLFFPSDAHRPNIAVAGNDHIKKIVVKIKFD